jgi:predicted GNAT family acetyltransferase
MIFEHIGKSVSDVPEANSIKEMIKGYEDIHSNTAYLEYDAGEESEVAYVETLYVPPWQRGKGVGAEMFKEWVKTLPSNVRRVRLKAATLGGSDSLKFWQRLGFTEAFSGHLYPEIENTMVLGVNGYSNPVVEDIAEDDEWRHWCCEEEADKKHLSENPQVKIA